MDDFRYKDIYAELGMLRWDIDRRTAIYARQSRPNGCSFGSCQAQLGICRDLAVGQRWIVTRVFTDEGKSSETLDRPAMKQLIAAIKSRDVDRLIVYSIDNRSCATFFD